MRVCKRKRMLEAQIENDAFLSRTWANSDGNRNSGYNLQSSIEIVCPANPRTDVEILRPLSLVGAHYYFTGVSTVFPAGSSLEPHARTALSGTVHGAGHGTGDDGTGATGCTKNRAVVSAKGSDMPPIGQIGRQAP
jgi:hypothetical protein